jgi:uncharacterized RDD family membrane protein YckC
MSNPQYPNQAPYKDRKPPAGFRSPQVNSEPKQIYEIELPAQPASLIQRAGAIIIDGFIAIGIYLAISGVLLFGKILHSATDQLDTTNISNLAGKPPAEAVGYILGNIIFYSSFYYVLMIARGQTVGDKVVGIRLIDAKGKAPGYRRAIVRFILQYVCSIFLITYLWVLWDKEKQTLHDKLAGTISISVRAKILHK